MGRAFTDPQERIFLYFEQDGLCAICGEEMDDHYEIDHIVPYSKGGRTVLENGQAVCRECNQKKGNK
jgi:5-methylcytosine-specific restriction endonuclease McrA